MKKTSEVLGLGLLGVKEGREAGTSQDFVVGADSHKVEYLIFKAEHGYGFRAMKTTDVLGIGKDYVMTATIENAPKLYGSEELMGDIEEGFFMIGAKVVTSMGNVLGNIKDFSFEETEGTIGTIELENGDVYDGSKIATLAGEIAVIDLKGASDVVGGILAEAQPDAAESPYEEPQQEAQPETEDYAYEEPQDDSSVYEQPAAQEEVQVETEDYAYEEPQDDISVYEQPAAEEEPKMSAIESLQARFGGNGAAAPAPEPEKPRNSALEEQSAAFLLGKTVKNDVVSDDGAIRLVAGTVLTQEVINMAKQHDLILTLTLNV